MSFKQSLLNGVFYIGLARNLGLVFQVLVTSILARLLTPAEYGVVALAFMIVSFFNLFSDVGLGVAVIQRKDLDDKELDSLFSMNVLLGLVIAGIFYLSSQTIADYYDTPELATACKWLSLMLVFNCASTVPMNVLYRDIQFKYMAITVFTVQFCIGVLSIILAFCGYGVYALVYTQIISSGLLFLSYFCKARRSLICRLDLKPIRKIFSYSVYNFLSSMLAYFSLNIDKLIIGKTISAEGLSYYEKSNRLVQLPMSNVSMAITPVLQPLFSEFQHDYKTLGDKYFKLISQLAYLSFSLAVLFFFTAREWVLIFFGGQWLLSIPLFEVMSLAMAVMILDSTTASVFNAANETKRGFYTMSVVFIVMVVSIMTASWFWNTLISMAYAYLVAKIMGFIISFYSLTRGIEGSMRTLFSGLVKPLLVNMMLAFILYLLVQYVAIENVIFSLTMKGAVWLAASFVLLRLISGMNIFTLFYSFIMKRS